MKCPDCGAPMQVCNTIPQNTKTYRRYKCTRCRRRVTMHEISEDEYRGLLEAKAKYERLYTICCGLAKKWDEFSQKMCVENLDVWDFIG